MLTNFIYIKAFETTFFALKINIPTVRAMWINAAQHFHQGRFSSSVFTDQSMDFALLDAKIHIIKRLNARKCLGNIAHFQNDIRHGFLVLNFYGVKCLAM